MVLGEGLEQHRREAEDRVRQLASRRGERGDRVVGAVDQGVGVEERDRGHV